MTTTCPKCHGRGQIIKTPCRDCHGEGVQTVNDAVTVHIPAGVDDGMKLRLVGKGEAGPPGGEAGDLYVIIRTAEHESFERSGDDLQALLSISMVQAALGAAVHFECIDGSIEVEVPAGSQPNEIITVPRRGMPRVNSGGYRGNLYLVLKVDIPKRLTEGQRVLLDGFSDA
jgi:molecular chaperone DnaJ